MNASRLSRSKIVAASVGVSAVLASVFLVALQVERGSEGTVVSDSGTVATAQITTTPTSAEPG